MVELTSEDDDGRGGMGMPGIVKVDETAPKVLEFSVG